MGFCRRRWLIALACLLVAVMSAGVSLLPHTDDGCTTEIHCAVCLSHLTGVAIQVSVPSLTLVPAPDAERPEPALSVGDIRTPSTLALRGPPAA